LENVTRALLRLVAALADWAWMRLTGQTPADRFERWARRHERIDRSTEGDHVNESSP